jgi:cation transport ATPase
VTASKAAAPLAVLGLDVVAAAATWLAWNASGHDGVGAALAVLVLAAPIGLVLAIAVPPWLTQRVGRSLGVTAIGSQALERWQHVHTLVLDPFHSLTTGHLVVTGVHPIDPDHERNLRWFAGALAHSYDDPVGRALAKLAGRGRVSNVALEPGRGISGSIDRHPVRVGHPQWLGFGDEDADAQIGTTVAVDVDHRPLGRITVADEVRPDAARQLDRLRRTGLTPVLASAQGEGEMERLATLSASPAWHAETDPLQLARELSVSGEPIGLVHSDTDGTATLLVVDSTDGSPTSASADSLGLSTPSIDAVVDVLSLTVRSHSAERRALRLAWILLLLPLPLAALGLIPPVLALVVAVLTWVAVGFTASSAFLGIRLPPVPADEQPVESSSNARPPAVQEQQSGTAAAQPDRSA